MNLESMATHLARTSTAHGNIVPAWRIAAKREERADRIRRTNATLIGSAVAEAQREAAAQ